MSKVPGCPMHVASIKPPLWQVRAHGPSTLPYGGSGGGGSGKGNLNDGDEGGEGERRAGDRALSPRDAGAGGPEGATSNSTGGQAGGEVDGGLAAVDKSTWGQEVEDSAYYDPPPGFALRDFQAYATPRRVTTYASLGRGGLSARKADLVGAGEK